MLKTTVPDLGPDWMGVYPDDEYNRTLVSNVHPQGWKNPDPALIYNLVVIGAGTAGLVTAAGAASLGAKVALVERNLVGGDCLNVGCVPSKSVISASRVVGEICNAHRFGVTAPGLPPSPKVCSPAGSPGCGSPGQLVRASAECSSTDFADGAERTAIGTFCVICAICGFFLFSCEGERL